MKIQNTFIIFAFLLLNTVSIVLASDDVLRATEDEDLNVETPVKPPTPIIVIPKKLSKWDFQFTQAKEALESGRTRQALHLFGAILAEDPTDTEAWEMMALTLRKRHEHLKALRIYYSLSAKKGDLGKLVLSKELDDSWPDIVALYGNKVFPDKEEVQYLYDIAMTFYEYGVYLGESSGTTQKQVFGWSEKYLELCERLEFRPASVEYLRGLLAHAEKKEVSAGHHFYKAFHETQKDPDLTSKADSDLELLAGHKFTLEGRPEIAAHFYRDLQFNEEAFHESRFLAQYTEQDLAKGGPNFLFGAGMEKIYNVHSLDSADEEKFNQNKVLVDKLQNNSAIAKTMEAKAFYLSDPTDWMVSRFGFLFKNRDFTDARLGEFDQNIWGLTGRFDFSLGRYFSFLLNADYLSESGQSYHTDHLYSDQSKWNLSPGLKWAPEAGYFSLLFPIEEKSASMDKTINYDGVSTQTLSFGPRLVWDGFASSEWWAPLAYFEVKQIAATDYAGGGSILGFGFQDNVWLNKKVTMVPHFRWENQTRDLAEANEREFAYGLKVSIVPFESLARWQWHLDYEHLNLAWNENLDKSGNQSTWTLGTLVTF